MTDEKNLPVPTNDGSRLLLKKLDRMMSALPTESELTRTRFAQISLAMANSGKLANCEPNSVVNSIYGCARLGLIPDPPLGQIYVVPRNIKGVPTAQIIVGYRGYIELAHRSGEYAGISAEVVYQNDFLDVSYGTERVIKHTSWWLLDKDKSSGELWAAYATAHHKTGYVQFRVMSRSDVLKHRKASESKDSQYSPWVKWEEAMWRKTAVIDLSKYLRLSAEFNMAVRWEEQAERGEVQTIHGTDLEPQRPMASDHDPLLDKIDGKTGGDDGAPPSGEAPMDRAEMDEIWKQEAEEGHDV